MRQRLRKAAALLLTVMLTLQFLPFQTMAAEHSPGYTAGKELFEGEEGQMRQYVSETSYSLAPGVTEYETYTNVKDGTNQNIDFFCEVDLSQAQIMVGYSGMENILEKQTINWRMQTVSDQVKNTQEYFQRSEAYGDSTIVAALNADYYNMATGQPTGALIIDGTTYNPVGGKYYFGITKDGTPVISNSADTDNLAYAVGGGTVLVKDGQVNVGKGGRNVTYTAIGIKEDNTVVSMVCYGQRYPVSCGYTQYEVAEMMKARGCVTALLLDGSGSSTFVSRREGDDQVITRNNPSDGQERQVSSSIFIISNVKSTGEFDHAVISPVNEVYTPGSQVTFTAVGVDSSGAPAPLPEGASWSVETGFGTMDSNTGVFTSNGQTGDVTVTLNSGGQAIGSSTITIANPDQIVFAEDTASMGQGDTSDLGLQVYYQQREVHYKDGDFTWTIVPTQYSRRQWTGVNTTSYETIVETAEESPDQMQCLQVGTVSNNQLTCDPVYTGKNTNPNVSGDYVLNDAEKAASAITATVTVASTADPEVMGSVILEACKDPLIAMDFEGEGTNIFHSLTGYGGQFDENGQYTKFDSAMTTQQITDAGYDYTCVSYAGLTTDGRQVGKAQIVSKEDGYPVRFGEQSLRIDYDFSTNKGGTDGVCFGATQDIQLENMGNPTRIGLWVYIPKNTSNLWLRLQYTDGTNNTSYLNFSDNSIYMPNCVARQADGNWHYFEADISKLKTPVIIPANMSIRVMMATPFSQSTGPTKLWASPQGWTKCQTDENGNIILVDKDDPRVTSFLGGYLDEAMDIGSVVPDVVTINGDNYTIDKVPIPEYLGEYEEIAEKGSLVSGTLKELKGTLYFDNLTYVYGSTPEDTASPKIDSIEIKAGGADAVPLVTNMELASGALDVEAYFSDSVEDDVNNTGVESASLYVDGKKLDTATVDLGAGSIRGGIRLANGSHTIRLSVVDAYGNETTREYRVIINDPEGTGAAVEVTSLVSEAVLGGQVSLEFTPRDTTVQSVTAKVQVPRAFAQDYQLAAADGCTITSQQYNDASQTLSFTVTGSVNTGNMATLTLKIPTTASVGTDLSAIVSGQAGEETFAETVTWKVTAPYTVTAGQMIVGLADTCYFQITHTASGEPAQGVTLYSGETELGVSDGEGKVRYKPKDGQTSLQVYAKDGNGNVSATYTAVVSLPQGNTDGKPTVVWRNAGDMADTLNVGWFANPQFASETAQLQISQTEEGVESGKIYEGTCQLATFTDNNAAYVCGAVADDLQEATTYYYRVGDGTNWSEVKSFTTGYENTGVNVLVFGDLQESDNTVLKNILEYVGADKYDLTIQTGDLVDDGGSYALWNNTFSMLNDLETGRLFAIGNHEQSGTLDANELIYNQENGSSYYSAQYGNVFVATIAYNRFSQEVLDQLVKDAKASDATWKLLVTHQPPYYTNTVAGMGASTQEAIAKAVQEAGVDVVLSGHDHSYARTEPLYNGEVDQEQGITYFICGSLGDKGYSVTDNEDFHFIKATGDYSALYMTLSTTADTLSIQAYDYNNGSPILMDEYSKTKGEGTHTHSYTWDGASRLTCECGYTMNSANYTGYANYTVDGKTGQVYLNAGNLMKGVFAAGGEVLHAGDDGLLHNSETVNTAQCWEDGYLGCWCHDCNKFYQLSETRRQGHQYDENHVCTREVFDVNTFTYHTCGYQGKDISTMDIELAYQYAYYTGKPCKPAVTVTDPETGEEFFGQSTYGDYMPYWENNVNVGTATVQVVGYSDGPCYGSATVTFEVVPQNVKTEDFTYTTTTNSVHLSWNPSLGATKYIVYQNVNGTWTRLGIVSQPEYTVTGLDQGTYEFRIRPFATVDGKDYYSTKNSGIVTVELEGGSLSFQEGSTVTCTYGDPSFTNKASMEGSEEGFTYSSADPSVAVVDEETGEVTIVGAGSTIITAEKGEATGQYRLTVSPKVVELVWSGTEERMYDGTPSQVGATVQGLLENDQAVVTVTGGDQKNAGTHTATAVSLDNGNYALPEEASVSYTITPKQISSLAWSDTTKTYTGGSLAPEVSSTEIVSGDTVEFAVPTVVDPGVYVITAASKNPNYVVADEAEACEFTVALPSVTLETSAPAGEEGTLSYHFSGTTIVVTGFVGENDTVTVTLEGGNESASGTAYAPDEAQVSTAVTLLGVSYPLDITGLVVKPTNITVGVGETIPEIPEDLELTEEQRETLNTATASSKNFLEGVIASIASGVKEFVNSLLENEEQTGESYRLEVFEQLKVVSYQPGTSYTVDITPWYNLFVEEEAQESDSLVKTGMLENSQLTSPVQVSLEVPEDITLNEYTYVFHKRSDGRTEYIKPDQITGQVLTFTTTSFSEFTVVNDTRRVTITFPSGEDGGSVAMTFTPADIGKSLPQAENGWIINGKVYREFAEELLNLEENGLVAAPAEPSEEPDQPIGGDTPVQPEEPELPFEDVAEEDWFYEAVAYAYENGIMAGTSETTFAPNGVLDRAQAVQLLYNLEGQPVVTGDSGFSDVKKTDWWNNAVTWAAQNHVVAGVGQDKFAPEDKVTREQFAQMLYNYAQFKGYELTSSGDLSGFPDKDQISGWALDAMAWANGHGLINGHQDSGRIDPLGSATRGQAASIMAKFDQNLVG